MAGFRASCSGPDGMAKQLLIDHRAGLFMRLLTISGGPAELSLGLASGVAQGAALPGVTLGSRLAAFIAGVAMCWCGRKWIPSFKNQPNAQAAAAAAQPETKPESL